MNNAHSNSIVKNDERVSQVLEPAAVCGVGDDDQDHGQYGCCRPDLAPAPPWETAVLLLKPPDPDYVDMHVLDSITKEEILRNWIRVACSANSG